jgi:UDP-N-acetylmuramyl pentapeptide phosphotransferase/UDP-N-acetylglucosamine-1-phosphate transferase
MSLLWAVAGFAVSLIVTRIVELAARRRRLLDTPNDRSSHEIPVPRLGGVGIIAGTLTSLAASRAFGDSRVAIVFLGASLVAAIGLLDDVRRTSVAVKLAAQIAAATVTVILLDPDVAVGWPFASMTTLPAWASWLVATLWIVAICNVVNFMDGTDGLVAAYVSVAALALGLLLGASPLFGAVAAGCLGFLVWNRAPASIFMGDTGSQFIGFMVGAGLLVQRVSAPLLLGILVLAPLLFDTMLTLVRRAATGRNVLQAHREHLYQRIADRWGHAAVSVVYAAAGILSALAAFAYANGLRLIALAIVAAALAVIFLVSVRSQDPGPNTVVLGDDDN